MSKYDIEHLIQQWALEKLTAEQVIGQLLLHVKSLDGRMLELERPPGGLTRLEQSAMNFVGKREEK